MTRTEDNYNAWLADLEVDEIRKALLERGCREVLVRRLTDRQGNSKQQIYCGTDFTQVARIPSGSLVTIPTTSTKKGAEGKAVYRAAVDLCWLAPGFRDSPAPNSKLIFYPQYPEVRLSGFLQGSPAAPNSLLAIDKRGREDGRVLLLAPGRDDRVFALVLPPEARSRDALLGIGVDNYGPFRVWRLADDTVAHDPRAALMSRLRLVADLGWQSPMLLSGDGTVRPCTGTNCGGYTLEALVGVSANGRAEPDFAGWELKAHGATTLDRPRTAGVLTLMTPEPDGGTYRDTGIVDWVQTNGYSRRDDRWDFGGILRVGGGANPLTGAHLTLEGYDGSGSWSADGAVQVIGQSGEVIASWSFSKLLDHWKRKHARTAYVPYVANSELPGFRYGTLVHLGEGTSFRHLLDGIAQGSVYYDPGINLKLKPDGTWKPKKRSQFRAKSSDLGALYESWTLVDAADYQPA